MKNILIVGGTSGLGLELAKLFCDRADRVTITGRSEPEFKSDFLRFEHLPLNFVAGNYLSFFANQILEKIKSVDILIHAAGFYQEAKIDEISEKDMDDMYCVGVKSAQVFLSSILKMEKKLPGFIAITSTSQWTPRLKEPVYTAMKSALAMLARSVSLDGRVGKVLVVAPAGMVTPFWRDIKRENFDFSTMLDPKWVAEKIVYLYENKNNPNRQHYEFRFVKILRDPARVLVEETLY